MNVEIVEEYVKCRHCKALWHAADEQGFARHESRCALRVECPHCGASPRVRCWSGNGRTLSKASHSKRESLAATAFVYPENKEPT